MGSETVTIQNLEIIAVDTIDNYILVSGNVPGAKNSLVLIKSTVKGVKASTPKELVKYEVETVVDEVVETESAVETNDEATVEETKEIEETTEA